MFLSLNDALKIIPGGSSTNAKSPLRACVPDTPLFALAADGCHFNDERGRSWLDCDMALGSVVWGYRRAEIDEAIRDQLSNGIVFSIPAALEIEVASQILRRLEFFETLRFFKTGSEAVSAAVRVARAATQRTTIVSGSYHGWHDWAAFHWYSDRERLGIPMEVGATVRWLTSESADSLLTLISEDKLVAGVIVCPEHWQKRDLEKARAVCNEAGIILIFDEVKSSLRYGRRGVTGAVGVVPDLICISKGLANGLPLAVLAGSHRLMRHCVSGQVSGTYAGECLSLAAARAAENLINKTSEWPPWEVSCKNLMAVAKSTISSCGLESELIVEGYSGCFRIGKRNCSILSDPFRKHFVSTLVREGVFSRGYVVPSVAHQKSDFILIGDLIVQAIRSWSNLNS